MVGTQRAITPLAGAVALQPLFIGMKDTWVGRDNARELARKSFNVALCAAFVRGKVAYTEYRGEYRAASMSLEDWIAA